MVEIALDVLTAALSAASQTLLPRVILQPDLGQVSEPVPPPDPDVTPLPPSVMVSPQLIQNTAYRFTYQSVRYLWLHLFLEREGSGRISYDFYVVHDLPSLEGTQSSEGAPPVEGAPFTPPTFTVQTYTRLDATVVPIEVTIDVAHDPETSGSGQPAFGLTFQITNALPAFYPYLTAAIVRAIPMEEV